MRKLLCSLAILMTALLPAAAQQTKANMTTTINTNYPDNTSGLITPAILRSTSIAQVNSWQQAPQIRSVSSNVDTIAISDFGNLIRYNNGSTAVAVSMSQANGSFASFNVFVVNNGTGTVTFSPTISTICGNPTLALTAGMSAWIVSDGFNYQCGLGIGTPNGITNAMLATMPATTIKCNPNGSAGTPQDCVNPVLASAVSNAPVVTIQNSTADASTSQIIQQKNRTGGNTNSGDNIAGWLGQGFANTAQQTAAEIVFQQTGASSGSNIPTSIIFSTSDASGLLDHSMTFDNGGTLNLPNINMSGSFTGSIANSALATMGANTVKGNFTGSTARPADNAMPSCSDVGGNHLNYVSGTGVTCGTTSSSGPFSLLNTLTASNSGTLSDTTSFTSSFSSYRIVYINLIPATNLVSPVLQVHSGGSFQTSGYTESVLGNIVGSTFAQSNTTGIFIGFNNNTTNNSQPGLSGELTIYNPSGTTAYKIIQGMTTSINNSGGASANITFGGYWSGGTGAVDGFQFSFSSGNITSGTIKIYGIQ